MRSLTSFLSRRHRMLPVLLLAAAGTAAADMSSGDSARDWRFQVFLDDKEIGYHEFSLTEQAGRRVLETRAEFDVKFLFITAFRYRHRNTEVWAGECLASIDAETDSNGDSLTVSGEETDGGFRVVDNDGERTLSDCVQTFAYWNPSVLGAERLLNSQTGEYESVSVLREGEDRVDIDGEAVNAVRYRLSAEAGDIRLWYSTADNTWLALEAPAQGGRTIRYRPLVVPAHADAPLLAENR